MPVKLKDQKSGKPGGVGLTASIRMYNQKDLGDCFLLNFKAGEKSSWIMIDFGSYQSGNGTQENLIAKDIKKTVNGDELRIVVTHQHKDHVSGFVTAFEELKDLNVPELWLSFLDSDTDEAEVVRKVSKRYWDKNGKLNSLTRKVLGKNPAVKKMLDEKNGYDLFAEMQTNGQAYQNLTQIANDQIRFLTPGQNFGLPGIEDEVRVYVLGPPTDFTAIKAMNPKKGEDVVGLAMANQLNNATDFLLTALESLENDDEDSNVGSRKQGSARNDNYPFDEVYYTKLNRDKSSNTAKLYKADEGRQIEYEWLNDIGRLALHMDTLTNNTSLVLAFELIKSKKVLLFVGDAQIGNWKSWFDVTFAGSEVTTIDLLSRTVLYKAGHHSSHNATYRKALDMMNSKELVIMIPVVQAVSDKFRFLMCKPPMLQGYNRVAQGRVIRTDTIYQNGKGLGKLSYQFASNIKGVKVSPTVNSDKLYIEYEIK